MKKARETWQNASTAQKTSGVSGVIAAVLIGLLTTIGEDIQPIATKSYADTTSSAAASEVREALAQHEVKQQSYQKQQVVATNRAEIWRAKREIKRLQRDLEDPELPHAEKVRVENDIEEYKDLIECIRENKELCY